MNIPSPNGRGARAAGGEGTSSLLKRGSSASFHRSAASAVDAESEEQELRAFIEDFHKDLIKEDPALFQQKMKKAVASDQRFFRAFPQLYYQILSRRTEAKVLARTKRLLLDGDLHPENTELVAYKDIVALQPNDFDDAGKAPVALDMARMLGGAALLGPKAKRRALIAEASSAYKKALKLDFKTWAAQASQEDAVRRSHRIDRGWANSAGKPVTDRKLATRLLKAAGLSEDKWAVFDRKGAGLSSIGMHRYMFIHRKKGHAWEMKELRGPALAYFGPVGGPAKDRDRVAAAYDQLRKVPADATTFRFDGRDWMLRRRPAWQQNLRYGDAASAARVIGGMAARMHARQTGAADLTDALKKTTPRLIEGSLEAMDRMRSILKRLLKAGTWPTA